MTPTHPRALVHDGDIDYTLDPKATSVWITVDNISVYIKREAEGVVVDLWPRGAEDGDPIGSTYAFFSDAEETDEEAKTDV